MQHAYSIGLIYLASINIVTFITFGIDKWQAKRGKWRVRESVLLWLAAIGGSIGAWTGMQMWHHKTQHNAFRYGVPLIMMLHIALAVTVWLLPE